jgi:hypothetical protein
MRDVIYAYGKTREVAARSVDDLKRIELAYERLRTKLSSAESAPEPEPEPEPRTSNQTRRHNYEAKVQRMVQELWQQPATCDKYTAHQQLNKVQLRIPALEAAAVGIAARLALLAMDDFISDTDLGKLASYRAARAQESFYTKILRSSGATRAPSPSDASDSFDEPPANQRSPPDGCTDRAQSHVSLSSDDEDVAYSPRYTEYGRSKAAAMADKFQQLWAAWVCYKESKLAPVYISLFPSTQGPWSGLGVHLRKADVDAVVYSLVSKQAWNKGQRTQAQQCRNQGWLVLSGGGKWILTDTGIKKAEELFGSDS